MSDIQPDDLNQFKIDVLAALGDGPLHGMGILDKIEAYYGESVNHGRLYQNTDQLVDEGLISKSERDGRTNEYALTDTGARVLEHRRDWLAQDTTSQESQYWCSHCGFGPRTNVALLSHHGEAHPDLEPAFVEYDPSTDSAVADGGEVSTDGE